VVINPCGMIDAEASCRVTWTGPSGEESMSFSTAQAGAPAPLQYDRNDTTRIDPFPDDFYVVTDPSTATGFRVDVRLPDVDPTVKNILLAGTDGVKKLDGMSPLGPFVVALPDAVDASSVPLTAADSLDPMATLGLFDLDPESEPVPKRVPFDALLKNENNASGAAEHVLVVFPSVPLRPRGKYAFVVTNRALVSAERPLQASAFFEKVLAGGAKTADEERLSPRLERVVRSLTQTSPPLRADDLALALGITVRSVEDIPKDLLAIRAALSAADPPSFVVTSSVADPEPTSDVGVIVRGTFDAPSFRNGDFVRRDAAGQPVAEGTETIGFILAIPRSAEAAKAPIIFYQHGLPGSAEDEVPRAAGRGLAKAGFAVVGFTEVASRVVIPDGDIVKLNTNSFLSFLGAHDMPDYLGLLTHAEQLAFLRLIPELGSVDVLPFGAPDGTPDLDPEKPLGYFGISQGSSQGVGLLALAPDIHAAALTAGGARLSATLVHQAAEPLYNGIALLAPAFRRTELYTGLSLVQMVFDRQESQNLAAHLYRDPLPLGAPGRASVLMTEGLGDSLVPFYATRSAAMQMRIPQLRPYAQRAAFMPGIGGPVQGNVDDETTAAFFQYVPMDYAGATPSPGCVANAQKEGHYCAQTAAEAITQRVEFFTSALTGAPRIIDATPP
jgi:hypothetical protein